MTRLPTTHCERSLSGEQIDHLLDARGVAPPDGRGGQGVVGLELDHRPHHDAESRRRLLGRLELGEEVGVDSLAGLVALEELVAEGLDHVIERARDVGDVGLAQEGKERGEQAADRADRAAARVVGRAAPRRTPRKSSNVPSTRWTFTVVSRRGIGERGRSEHGSAMLTDAPRGCGIRSAFVQRDALLLRGPRPHDPAREPPAHDAQPRAARGGRDAGGAAARPRRGRHGQDPRHHHPHRLPHRAGRGPGASSRSPSPTRRRAR